VSLRKANGNEILCLCFGAVNGTASVWFDGELLGSIVDGCNPFCFPVRDSRDGVHTIALRTLAPAKSVTALSGKQGFWFTDAPGIWQSCWAEYRPLCYIEDLLILPDYRKSGEFVAQAFVVCESHDILSCSVEHDMLCESQTALLRFMCPSAGLHRLEIEYSAGAGRVSAIIEGHGASFVFQGTPNDDVYDKTLIYLRLLAGENVISIKKAPDHQFFEKAYVRIREAKIAPADDNISVSFKIAGKRYTAKITLADKGRLVASAAFSAADLPLWNLESPILHTVSAIVEDDQRSEVSRSFGLREFSAEYPIGDTQERESAKTLLLNGEAIEIRGVLDQGYNPWGLTAYCTDDGERPGSMLFDIEAAREFGYNLIRMHIKDNEPAWYSLCDRLGMLVWDELPVNFHARSDNPAWRGMYFRQLHAMSRKHNYHPSVVMFSAFNESWGITGDHERSPWESLEGQEMIRLAAMEYKMLNRGALVVDNSGYGKTEQTDIIDYHSYPVGYAQAKKSWGLLAKLNYPGSAFNFYSSANNTLMRNPEILGLLQPTCAMKLDALDYAGSALQNGQPVIISEFLHTGGLEQLVRTYGFSGYVRMNIAAYENEDAAPLSSTRKRRDFGYLSADLMPLGYACMNSRDLLCFDAPRLQIVRAGEFLSVDIIAAIRSENHMGGLEIRYALHGVDANGLLQLRLMSGVVPIAVHGGKPFAAASLPIEVAAAHHGLLLFAELVSGGDVLAYANIQMVNAGAGEPSAPIVFDSKSWRVQGELGLIETISENGRHAAWVYGPGEIQMEAEIPKNLPAGEYVLLFEASSCEALGGARVTDETEFPTNVSVALNGAFHGTFHLHDNPCDERGLFSNALGFANGECLYQNSGRLGYGYKIAVALRAEQLDARPFKATLVCDSGGLVLYGRGTGRYGCDPIIIPLNEFMKSEYGKKGFDCIGI
jgi:hypothetical protein